MNHHPRFGQDDFSSVRTAFIQAKQLALQYGARLRRLAHHVGVIVKGFDQTTIEGQRAAQSVLIQYANTLTPWAEAVGERMVAEVAQSNKNSWKRLSAKMGRALHREIETAPTGATMRALKAEQVRLIRSLPLEAAQRIHDITTEGISRGMRADEVVDEIMKTGDVTLSRAKTIARTEVGRTATALTQARAEHIGSTHYQWLTSRDGTVRPSHRQMEGKIVAWSDPPTLDGLTGHAGSLPNCRCTPLPIFVPR